MDRATMLYNQSDSIDVREPSTWIGKGFLLLLQGRLDQAVYQFKLSLDRNPNDVAAILGRACIFIEQKSYREALVDLQKALQLSAGYRPDIRFGLGLCWYKLGGVEQAKYAFERVVERVFNLLLRYRGNQLIPENY
jgi:RNA polymerase-associated protein CTR9